MSEEPIKPNPSPEQFAALKEELQKLRENNAKLLDQNIKAREAGKAIPPDVDVNELIAFKQKKEQEELSAIEATLKNIEKEIIELKSKAPEKINKIAIETSTELVKYLIGAEVNNSSVSSIVKDVLSKNKEKYHGI